MDEGDHESLCECGREVGKPDFPAESCCCREEILVIARCKKSNAGAVPKLCEGSILWPFFAFSNSTSYCSSSDMHVFPSRNDPVGNCRLLDLICSGRRGRYDLMMDAAGPIAYKILRYYFSYWYDVCSVGGLFGLQDAVHKR